jgi:hypothetical protein
MTGPRRVIASLFAAILGLCALGVSLPAGAAGPAVAPPTHLRPVQSETDCAKVLTLAAFGCDAAVKAGDLQLIWDESDKRVTGATCTGSTGAATRCWEPRRERRGTTW